jgi:hypothetical protein
LPPGTHLQLFVVRRRPLVSAPSSVSYRNVRTALPLLTRCHYRRPVRLGRPALTASHNIALCNPLPSCALGTTTSTPPTYRTAVYSFAFGRRQRCRRSSGENPVTSIWDELLSNDGLPITLNCYGFVARRIGGLPCFKAFAMSL